MGVDWGKFCSAFVVIYVLIFAVFKLVSISFFPDFYFGPLHALSLMGVFILVAGIIEFYKAPKEAENDQVLANAALMLISSIISNGNTIEVPAYIVNATAKKLNENKLILNIEEKDDKYIMKVEVK